MTTILSDNYGIEPFFADSTKKPTLGTVGYAIKVVPKAGIEICD